MGTARKIQKKKQVRDPVNGYGTQKQVWGILLTGCYAETQSEKHKVQRPKKQAKQ